MYSPHNFFDEGPYVIVFFKDHYNVTYSGWYFAGSRYEHIKQDNLILLKEIFPLCHKQIIAHIVAERMIHA